MKFSPLILLTKLVFWIAGSVYPDVDDCACRISFLLVLLFECQNRVLTERLMFDNETDVKLAHRERVVQHGVFE